MGDGVPRVLGEGTDVLTQEMLVDKGLREAEASIGIREVEVAVGIREVEVAVGIRGVEVTVEDPEAEVDVGTQLGVGTPGELAFWRNDNHLLPGS